jgi:hypothetical protein
MNNESTHKELHKKRMNLHLEIANQGELQHFPCYYGSTFSPCSPSSPPDASIKLAAASILSNSPAPDLPPLLQTLLQQEKTALLAQLLEHYTRKNLDSFQT